MPAHSTALWQGTAARSAASRLAALPVLALVGWGCSDAAGPGEGPPVDQCAAAVVAYPDEREQVGSVEHVHDPAIARQGDWYYVYSTNDGIPIRRSRDLVRWEWVGRVFPNQRPAWATAEVPGVEAPWAPDIAYFNGRYHLYYSLSTFGSQRSVIGLATSPTLDPADPDYHWQDHGKVLESRPGVDDHNAIDPSVVIDEAGVPWLSWGSWWSGIKMHRLDPETGLLAAGEPAPYSLASRPAGSGIEGPYVVRRGEYYYLFISWDLCCRGVESTYNIRVGRSRSVTGPYLDRRGTPLTAGGGTLMLASHGSVRGPGHNSVLVEGDRQFLVHHYYDARSGGIPHLQIRPLIWDADGWPLAGNPHDGTGVEPASSAAEVVGSWAYWSGDDPPRRQVLHADGALERCDAEGSWSFDAPWLILSWSPAGSGGGARTQRVWVSADGDHLVGRTEEGHPVRGYLIERD